jgi:hypothetical protein
MIDQWNERLRCVLCGDTGLVSLSHVNGARVPTVDSVTGAFKAVQTEYGPDFHCVACEAPVAMSGA